MKQPTQEQIQEWIKQARESNAQRLAFEIGVRDLTGGSPLNHGCFIVWREACGNYTVWEDRRYWLNLWNLVSPDPGGNRIIYDTRKHENHD